jgi:hypothetical protein
MSMFKREQQGDGADIVGDVICCSSLDIHTAAWIAIHAAAWMATDWVISKLGWGRGADWARKVRSERGRRKGEATLSSFVKHAKNTTCCAASCLLFRHGLVSTDVTWALHTTTCS